MLRASAEFWGGLARKWVTKTAEGWAKPFVLESTQPLLHFGADDAISRWRLNSDREHGGASECLVAPIDDAIRFSGHTSLELDKETAAFSPEHGKKATRTGWVAMHARIAENEWEDLYNFHGLSFRVRFGGAARRRFVLNIRSTSVLGEEHSDDLYQAALAEWDPLREAASAAKLTGKRQTFLTPSPVLSGATLLGAPVGLADGRDAGKEEEDEEEGRDDLSRRLAEGGLTERGLQSTPGGQLARGHLARGQEGEAPGEEVRSEHGEWTELRLPFCAWHLTWRGYMQEPRGMHLDRISHIGIFLSDGDAGPFSIDLHSVSAFRYEDVGGDDPRVRMALEGNRRMGYPAE
jgi:hypothetical protein